MNVQKNAPENGHGIRCKLDKLHAKLESLARNGEWSEFSNAMVHRDDLLAQLPEIEQGVVYKAAVRTNDRILKMAQSARQSVADELTSLRRSRRNSDCYESQRNA